jgi:hypothetical protein
MSGERDVMTERPTLKISDVRQDGSHIYYRVCVNGVKKPSLVFVRSADRTAHSDAALKEWCEHNLHKLESGKVVEANVSARE